MFSFDPEFPSLEQQGFELLLGQFPPGAPKERAQVFRLDIELFAASHAVVLLDELNIALADTDALGMEPLRARLAHNHD